jgi:hypothetical protein
MSMAFQLTVQEDGWHADVFRQGNAFLVVINFGYNAETKTSPASTLFQGMEGGLEFAYAASALISLSSLHTSLQLRDTFDLDSCTVAHARQSY